MSTLKADSIKHASSSSNNIVLNSNGTITATNTNSIKPASATGAGSGNHASSSYADFVTCTITPNQSTSHMLILTTGTVGGEEGNNNNNTGSGTVRVTRDGTQIGDELTSSTGGAERQMRFDQALIDTTNHGGSAVTYKLQLKNTGGNQSHAYIGASRSTNGSAAQGSARLTVLEIIQ